MSKPKDPVIAVVNYFEGAELLLVQQTLAIVQVIVKNRQHMEGPPRHPAVKKPAAKKSAAEKLQDDSIARLNAATN